MAWPQHEFPGQRILAVGDIHGCSAALDLVLEEAAPGPEDILVFLGDYVDRGPDSRGVVERLLEWSGRCRCHFLRGNHELFLLRSLQDLTWAGDWVRVGGMETLTSYGAATTRDLPQAHLEFLESTCKGYWETETHIFAHAGVDVHVPLTEQPEEALYWQRFTSQQPHPSGKVVICGHTVQKSGLPLDVGYAICLDTGVYANGYLTCLEVHSGLFWQASQSGELREGYFREDD